MMKTRIPKMLLATMLMAMPCTLAGQEKAMMRGVVYDVGLMFGGKNLSMAEDTHRPLCPS